MTFFKSGDLVYRQIYDPESGDTDTDIIAIGIVIKVSQYQRDFGDQEAHILTVSLKTGTSKLICFAYANKVYRKLED